jgi:hypothetical protein
VELFCQRQNGRGIGPDKEKKAKKANKDKKGNKTSEDFSPDQAPAGCPNQKYRETGSITSDEDEPCLK